MMTDRQDSLGVPETSERAAWILYTERGVVLDVHRDAIEARRALAREWAAVGRPLR